MYLILLLYQYSSRFLFDSNFNHEKFIKIYFLQSSQIYCQCQVGQCVKIVLENKDTHLLGLALRDLQTSLEFLTAHPQFPYSDVLL